MSSQTHLPLHLPGLAPGTVRAFGRDYGSVYQFAPPFGLECLKTLPGLHPSTMPYALGLTYGHGFLRNRQSGP